MTLFPSPRPAGLVRIAVERGVDTWPEGLAYLLPADLSDVSVGERVMVPLGRGNTATAGYVIERLAADAEVGIDRARLKALTGRDHSGASLPGELVHLARWLSGYYGCPIGLTLAGVLPAAVKHAAGRVLRTMVELGAAPPEDARLSRKQKRALEIMASLPEADVPIELRELADRAEIATLAPLRKLIESGFVVASKKGSVEAKWAAQAIDAAPPRELTPAQRAVVSDVGSALDKGFSAHLLFGVTGAGKTEVYIRLLEQTLAAGRVAIVLVPEISLTPQTGGRIISRFERRTVAILHSALTPAQRNQQWNLIREGRADIVLGARSAIFAPIPDGRLGLIVVDEEHDGSYKQDQAPRYHGRDVAVRRAQLAGCPVLLGSATPSLESWHNATIREAYRLHRLPERSPGLRVPRVDIVDFAEERRARHDRRVHLIGPRLEEAIGRTLDPHGGSTAGQVLLLLNRRGFGNYVACPDPACGWTLECDHCDATMVCHLRDRRKVGVVDNAFVRCHHCLAETKLPLTCPQCGNKVTVFGLGTQRVEQELAAKFPILIDGRTMLRVDSDSMRGANDFHSVLTRFATGELRLLIGTQMIAKGLDFPGVRLVGVINADTALNLPDFRAAERTFQLVAQVAGRCGRGSEPGRAIVQSFQPAAPAIRLAAQHDFESFARLELSERRRCHLPPFSRMIRLVVRDEDLPGCIARAQKLHNALANLIARMGVPDSSGAPGTGESAVQSRGGQSQPGTAVRLRGPAECPIARISGKHRRQVELFAEHAGELQRVLALARSEGIIVPGEALAVDVDPVVLV